VKNIVSDMQYKLNDKFFWESRKLPPGEPFSSRGSTAKINGFWRPTK